MFNFKGRGDLTVGELIAKLSKEDPNRKVSEMVAEMQREMVANLKQQIERAFGGEARILRVDSEGVRELDTATIDEHTEFDVVPTNPDKEELN